MSSVFFVNLFFLCPDLSNADMLSNPSVLNFYILFLKAFKKKIVKPDEATLRLFLGIYLKKKNSKKLSKCFSPQGCHSKVTFFRLIHLFYT